MGPSFSASPWSVVGAVKETSPNIAGTLLHQSPHSNSGGVPGGVLRRHADTGHQCASIATPVGPLVLSYGVVHAQRLGMGNDSQTELPDVVEVDETIIGGPVTHLFGPGVIRGPYKSLVLGAVIRSDGWHGGSKMALPAPNSHGGSPHRTWYRI